MNLPLFLKTVDGLITRMSHNELEIFIHETARTLPEGKRDEFISRLKMSGTAGKPEKVYEMLELSDKERIEGELKNILEILMEIDEGGRYLMSEINEEYDDWYNSDADEFIFDDPEDVLGTVDLAMDLVHKCVDSGLYEEGYELAEMLSVMVIQDEGEYNSCVGEVLYMEDLEMHNLLSYDFRRFCKDAIYLAYQGNILEDRADAVCRMMDNLKCRDIGLEQVMQNGKEEPGQFEEFLELWIEYLSHFPGDGKQKQILDAQLLLNDDKKELENAKKYAGQYPALYEQYLRKKLTLGKDSECFEIGNRALTEVAEDSVWRSRIALLTARYALRIQKTDEAERCWLEALRSRRTPVNYMRIFTESKDYSKYAKEVTDICMSGNKGSYYNALLFFEGKFKEVLEEGMNEKEALGWSYTFMKEGIALFLLYLYQGEVLPSGLGKMCDRAVSALEFSGGIQRGVREKPVVR